MSPGNFSRECFYLKSADQYFYNPNYAVTGDIQYDIKTLLSIYSAGHNLLEIDNYLDEMLSYTYHNVQWTLSHIGDYYLASSFLAFAKIRRPNTSIDHLHSIVPFTEDRLMTFIAKDGKDLDYGKFILNLNPYIYLHNYIVDSTKNEANVISFLIHFYKSFTGRVWHDSHKNNEKAFFGYWSISLAAIVQKLDLDDSLFMDHMYYPRDLMGKELLPTWEDSARGVQARRKKDNLLKVIEANKPAITEKELKRLIITEYEEVLNAKNKDIFSASFNKRVQQIKNSTSKIASAKELKEFIRDFASEITKDINENHPFNQLLNNDELKSQITSVISELKTIDGISLDKELNDFFDQNQDEKLQKQKLQDFKQLGFSLLQLDATYDVEDEKYWNELETLFEPFQTPKTDPMIDLKNSIAETLSKKLNSDGKSINFNFSIDDYF